jgi:hypothetical protein
VLEKAVKKLFSSAKQRIFRARIQSFLFWTVLPTSKQPAFQAQKFALICMFFISARIGS